MPNELGIGFMPGGQGGPTSPPNEGAGTTPLQQAIKFLSLRLPRFSGQGAITGAGLMGRPSQPPDAILEILRRLGGLGGGMPGAGPTMAPPPVFTPGTRGPRTGQPATTPTSPGPIWRVPRMPRTRFQEASDPSMPGGTSLDPGDLMAEYQRSQGGLMGGGRD